MSAIFGIIDFNGKQIDEVETKHMQELYKDCVIDRFEKLEDKGVFLACGLQYFTPEAHMEKMPYHREDNIYYTADVVLDNRDELIDRLGWNRKEEYADGEILYEMYRRYGKSSLNDILGSYSFIYYDKKEKKISAVLDAVGSRCLYYCIQNSRFCFSTLLEPLTELSKSIKVNERWISDYVAMKSLTVFSECEETPIEGIYRVAPSHWMEFTEHGIKKEKYWIPEARKELHLKNDEEYKTRFRETFAKAVRCTMRSDKELAVLLSGGFDSTAVACFASRELKKTGERLHSYTFVPEMGYKAPKDAKTLGDETEYVKITQDFLGNVDSHFLSMEGKNAWDERKNMLEYYEIPYKSVQNHIMLAGVSKQAYADGNRIMLTGSIGNSAFSFGNYDIYMNSLFQTGRFCSFWKELNYLNSRGISRKRILKLNLKNAWSGRKKRQQEWNDVIGNAYIRKEAVEKYALKSRVLKKEKPEKSWGMKEFRKVMAYDLALRQIGEYETKISLKSGILFRDPTRDKRLMEFCISLPPEQFCKRGMERRLVSEYLQDDMPKEILTAPKRGQQSADTLYRLQKDWDRISKEMRKVLEAHMDSKIIDTGRMLKKLDEIGDNVEHEMEFEIMMLIYDTFTLEYMDKVTKHGKSEGRQDVSI